MSEQARTTIATLTVRALGAILALLALLFPWPASASDPLTAGAHDAYTYDAPENYTAPEGRPPIRGYANTTYDAVDLRSHGTSARQSGARSRATYDYDDTALYVRSDIGAGPTHGPARAHNKNLPPFERFQVAANAGRGADNVVNGVRLRAQLTGKEIAGGHAFEKHILDLGEFPGIRTRAQFASHIEDVVLNGQMRTLGGGRTAFWRGGTVVIRNPRAPDGGTAFQPTDGYDYFLNQLH